MNDEDLQRIRASQGWRQRRIEVFSGTSQGTVLVKGQRATRGPLRYRVLNAVARLAGLPMLRSAPALGGAAAQGIEVQRLRALAAAGVNVPQVLHVDAAFFVQGFVSGPLLFELFKAGGDAALLWWQRGVAALADVHARGQYLSQAFTRNMMASGEDLVMIDFEDDPLSAMPLELAQARDWLAFLYTSAMTPPGSVETMAPVLRAALASAAPAARAHLQATTRRLSAWLPRQRRQAERGWRRYLAMIQFTLTLLQAAGDIEEQKSAVHDDEAIHARHH